MKVQFNAVIRWSDNEKCLVESNITLRSAYVKREDMEMGFEGVSTVVKMDQALALKKGLINGET